MNKNDYNDKFESSVTNELGDKNISNSNRYFSNVFELISAYNKLKNLINQYKDTDDIFKRKELSIEISNLKTKIMDGGIHINFDKYYEKISEIIFNYLKKFGYDKEFIEDEIKTTNTSIGFLEEFGSGKAYSGGYKISLDIKYASFDDDGNFIGIKDDKKDEVIHAVTHECFHLLSTGSKGVSTSIGINEGMTEMFTCRVLGSNKFRSKSYDFSVRICELFVEMFGEDAVLDEYMNGKEQYKIIENIFDSKEEFSTFKENLTRFIKEKDSPTIENDKKEFLETFRDKTLIPFCIKNPERCENIVNKFNYLFESEDVRVEELSIENGCSSKK